MSAPIPNLPNFVTVPSQSSNSSSNVSESVNEATSSSHVNDDSAPYVSLPSALWHAEAGLVVSPNTNYVPKMRRDVPHGRVDFSTPSVLPDSEIYMAFRPRFAKNTGALFGRLNLSRAAMAESIVTLRTGKYILSQPIGESWARLETALLDVADRLLFFNDIPAISYPEFPWEYGYLKPHDTHAKALGSAILSRDAFVNLTSVVTFALTLYMDARGSLDTAWDRLMQKSKVHAAWLDLLAESYVCNFSEQFRVGGVINPYLSRWASRIPQFVCAHVPIWILWGHEYKTVRPFDAEMEKTYFPPLQVIEDAKVRANVYNTQILPSMRYAPFADKKGRLDYVANEPMGSDQPFWDYASSFSGVDSSEPPTSIPPPQSPATSTRFHSTPPSSSHLYPLDHKDAEQRALESLNAFFARVQQQREVRLAHETPEDKQQRIDREEHAKTHRYSKRSTFYVWRDNGDGHYTREKVNSKQVEDEWSNFTRNQRRFTGHTNEWDLCPQLPEYSDENPKSEEPYRSEDDSGDSDSSFILPLAKKRTGIQFPNDHFKANLDSVTSKDLLQPARANNALDDEESDVDRLNASHKEEFLLETYLRERFGYDITSPENWNPKIEPTNDVTNLNFKRALVALSFEKAPGQPGTEEAILRLVKILSNRSWTFAALPASFDHSPASSARLSLESDTLEIQIVRTTSPILYIVHKRGRLDESPWSIGTSDASTVLLIFRMKWPTVEVIARELVRRGVPFNTLATVETPPVAPATQPVRGLGSRPQGYEPTPEDYLEYLRIREDLLKGPKGRAALLHGGIISRIARDVLEPRVVLDGPSSSATVVTQFDCFTLVDDQLTANDMDIICGVYYVRMLNSPQNKSTVFASGTRSECSWWPQNHTWHSQNCFLRMEWSELAENYYQTNLDLYRTNAHPKLLNASKWRSALRKANKMTKIVQVGTEHYQAGYLEEYLHK